MTEITATIKSPLYPSTNTKRNLVDPLAFGLAMVGGPVVTGILGAPLLLIPSFAAIFGGPIYLLVGVPVMLTVMQRHPPSVGDWALLAFVTHTILFTLLLLLVWSTGGNHDGASLFLLFGGIFAPIWGAISGQLYGRLERDFYKQTI